MLGKGLKGWGSANGLGRAVRSVYTVLGGRRRKGFVLRSGPVRLL